MPTATQPPSFDSVKRALAFAFNADAAFVSPPTMNKMMAAITPPKSAKMQQEEAVQSRVKRSNVGGLRGFDRAAHAGFILQLVTRLDSLHQRVLEARMTRYRDLCSCGSPCCCGWRPVPRWARAIDSLCEVLKDQADVLKTPGKRGFSTDPRLRKLILEAHFSPQEPPSEREIARIMEIDHHTVSRHKTWITRYLLDREDEAWGEIATIFDGAGVTGALDF